MAKSYRTWAMIFLVPGLALYAFIVLAPTVQAVNTGLYSWQAGQKALFVGLGNFGKMFADPVFQESILHTGQLMLGATAIQLPLGMIFALLIFSKPRWSSFFQTVFFLPMVLSTAVLAVLWNQVYAPQYGLLNSLLRSFGLGFLAKSWLGDPTTALWAIIAVVGWQYVALYMMIFLGAMQRISPSIFEAAALDGSVGWSRFWRVTFPLMSDTIRLALVLVVTGAVQYFNLIWAMTQGGPANASQVLASYMYQRGFPENQLGFACAVATFMLVLNLVLAAGLQRSGRRAPLEMG
jgi:raffinose/stachyose/melibiose transport system permease protein